MSRIDEALARARSITPEDLSPPVVPPSGATGAVFAVEAVPEERTADHEAAAQVDAVPRLPAVSKTSEAVASVSHNEETIIEAGGRIEDLALGEKLMLNGGRLGDPTPVEQYRRLAGRLCMAQAEHGTRLVMITSALPGEGKTLTAANLALTLSESYKREVLLIDADLRKPCIHQIFEVPNASGLNEGLRTDGDRKVPLMRFTDHLSLLTAGRPELDPMSVLSGSRMQRVLQEAGTRFDWVIIDTPPVALLTDAHLLSSLVDAVLLVVRGGRTPLPAINTAVQAVGRERILGIVLNHVETSVLPGSYNYNYDYNYRASA